MLTKERLISAAKEAKEVKAHVYIMNSPDGIQVTNKSVTDYSTEQVANNPDIIKVMQPDSILKYNWSTWKLKDVSIDAMVDGINEQFGNLESTIGSV